MGNPIIPGDDIRSKEHAPTGTAVMHPMYAARHWDLDMDLHIIASSVKFHLRKG